MFIQLIEGHTDDLDALNDLDKEWETAADDRHTVRRSIITTEHGDRTHFVVLAFFDSYESAMENSRLPETDAMAAKFASLVKDLGYRDLDVLDDRKMD